MRDLPPEQFTSSPCSPDPEMERQIGEIEGQIEDVDQTPQLSIHPLLIYHLMDHHFYKDFLFLRFKG